MQAPVVPNYICLIQWAVLQCVCMLLTKTEFVLAGNRYSSRIVETKSGAIRGVILELNSRHIEPVEVFKVVPYALPPIGNQRFEEPKNLPSWKGTKLDLFVLRFFLLTGSLPVYSIILIAFALCFYTLLGTHKSDAPDDVAEVNNFVRPGVAIIKAVVLLTGEFDASNIDFKQNATIYVLSVIFFFLISTVLNNLLNGLAVSDTQVKTNGYSFRSDDSIVIDDKRSL